LVSKGGGGSGCDVAAAADAFDCSLCFVDVFCLFFFCCLFCCGGVGGGVGIGGDIGGGVGGGGIGNGSDCY